MLPNVVCFYEAGAGAGVEAEGGTAQSWQPGDGRGWQGAIMGTPLLYTIHGDISLSEEKPNSQETYNSVVI